MQRLPLIDLSNVVSGEIEAACRDVGFMYVTGHGIPTETITNTRQAVIEYFSLPMASKQSHRISRDNYRGYIPTNFFSPAGSRSAADNYEGYKLHFEVSAQHPICSQCDLYGPNKWPEMVGFRSNLLAYWNACDRVARVLLGELADILNTPKDEFLQLFDLPLTNMTMLHYPPQSPDANAYGIHPHKDTDALTILAPDPVGGLMVKARESDEWIPADAQGDALIVNIGDLLELWSGGYFVSTPHKVVNTSGVERYSFPYFAVPRFDTVVEPLITPQVGFQRDSVHVGDVSREVWRANWLDVDPDTQTYDLGTLEN